LNILGWDYTIIPYLDAEIAVKLCWKKVTITKDQAVAAKGGLEHKLDLGYGWIGEPNRFGKVFLRGQVSRKHHQ
jgi:hypothetical protein